MDSWEQHLTDEERRLLDAARPHYGDYPRVGPQWSLVTHLLHRLGEARKELWAWEAAAKVKDSETEKLQAEVERLRASLGHYRAALGE